MLNTSYFQSASDLPPMHLRSTSDVPPMYLRFKLVPAIHCFAAGKRQESRRLSSGDLTGRIIPKKRKFFVKRPNNLTFVSKPINYQ